MKKLYEHIFKRHRLKQLNEAQNRPDISIPVGAPFNNGFPWRPIPTSPFAPNAPIPPLPTANPDDTISPTNPRPGNPLEVVQDRGTYNAPNENTPRDIWIYNPRTGKWEHIFKVKSPAGPHGYWWGMSPDIFELGRDEPPQGAWVWDPELGWYQWGITPPRPSTPSTPVTPSRPIVPHWSRPDAPRGPRY